MKGLERRSRFGVVTPGSHVRVGCLRIGKRIVSAGQHFGADLPEPCSGSCRSREHPALPMRARPRASTRCDAAPGSRHSDAGSVDPHVAHAITVMVFDSVDSDQTLRREAAQRATQHRTRPDRDDRWSHWLGRTNGINTPAFCRLMLCVGRCTYVQSAIGRPRADIPGRFI
jgi:hypothetical protein